MEIAFVISITLVLRICKYLIARAIPMTVKMCLFPRAMRKVAMLAWIFDECREVFDFGAAAIF